VDNSSAAPGIFAARMTLNLAFLPWKVGTASRWASVAIALSNPKSDLARIEITHFEVLDLCFFIYVFDISKFSILRFAL
jgi:hypothetical protein